VSKKLVMSFYNVKYKVKNVVMPIVLREVYQ